MSQVVNAHTSSCLGSRAESHNKLTNSSARVRSGMHSKPLISSETEHSFEEMLAMSTPAHRHRRGDNVECHTQAW